MLLLLGVNFCPSAILVAYDELSQSASDEALRNLLSVFSEHHDKVKQLLTDLISLFILLVS